MPTDGADSAGTAGFLASLARMGLLSPGEQPRITPLTGGVSSDIVRVDLLRGPVCVKRALPKLKVKAAPKLVERRADLAAIINDFNLAIP